MVGAPAAAGQSDGDGLYQRGGRVHLRHYTAATCSHRVQPSGKIGVREAGRGGKARVGIGGLMTP